MYLLLQILHNFPVFAQQIFLLSHLNIVKHCSHVWISSDAECRFRGHECIRHGNEGFGTCQPPQGCRTNKDCGIGYTCNYLGNCLRVYVTPCSLSVAYGRRGSTVACKPGYECVSAGWGMGRCHPQCRTNQDCSYGYTCNAMHPNLYLFYGPQNGVCHQPLQSPQPLLPP